MENIIKKWYYPAGAAECRNESNRLYYLDNLKFILITLVVISHFALELTYLTPIKYLFYYIYIFHMPCFIFINGYLAKRLNAGGKLRVNRILSIFWMYLLFKSGNYILEYLFHGNAKLSLFEDASATWYMLALCIWYLFVPVLERIKSGYLIIGSFLIGLFAGYINSIDKIFSLSRVFVFFPFFILGFCMSKERLESFLNKRLRLPAAIFLGAVAVCVNLGWQWLKHYKDIIYGSAPYYSSLGDAEAYGVIVRGVWYLLAIAMSAAVMLLVPRSKMFFSVLGERTLQVYMTHIWVRNALAYTGFFLAIKSGPNYLAVLVLLGTVVLAFLLSNRWLKKLYDWLMADKLFLKLEKN